MSFEVTPLAERAAISRPAGAVSVPRVVVGIERLLRRPQLLGHVLAGSRGCASRSRSGRASRRRARRPGARCAATSGWRAFQRSSPASASSFFCGAGDLDERLRGHAAAARLRPRRRFDGCDARRLAGLLRVVRRPRRVALALGLLPRRQLEERVERAGLLVDPRVAVADRGEARRHRAQREVARVAGEELVPGERRRHARVRLRAAPSRRSRPCGPWRSGCSRGRRRGAPPSTTCWSRSSGARRSTSRASASAARRTSANAQRGWIRTLTWMPREPDVFGQPTRPRSASTSRDDARHRRGSATTRRPAPGRGRRAARRGGRGPSARTGCGCSSRQPRFAIQASAAASRGTTSSAVRPEGKLSATTSIQSRPLVGRALLVEELAVDAVRRSARARSAGRPRRAARPRRPRGSSARPRAW